MISIVISIIPLSLLTCLKWTWCLQQPIWNLEWTLFPQFGYGQSKSISIFRQCWVRFSNRWKTMISIVIYVIQLSLLTCFKLMLCSQQSMWHLEQIFFPQFWYEQSKSINIFRQCWVQGCHTDEKGDPHIDFYNTTITTNLIEFMFHLQQSNWNLEQTLFTQFWYGQSKSIIFRQCLVQDYQKW